MPLLVLCARNRGWQITNKRIAETSALLRVRKQMPDAYPHASEL